MTDLIDVIDKSFLEFLEERLMSLCQGKVSVVFEDLQSKPITKFPGTRVFPRRKEENICQRMIDCPVNDKAQLKCLLSDAAGARIARSNKKGYLYRCHEGRGFPNFLFPIVIWPEEVVGYLYVGQFVFKELQNDEKAKFIKQLKESHYIIENAERFVSEWTDADILEFWEYIIEPKLRRRFTYASFSKLISDQVDKYGVSPEEFFDIIELIEGLANYLSTLGNSLYLLKSLVEIERRLPPILKAKYDFALSELRDAIASAVTPKSESEVDVGKTVQTIAEKSIEILVDCKNYEDKYIRELAKPYKVGIIKPSEDIQRWILEFYVRNATFEVILYSKIRTILERRAKLKYLVEKGDELVRSFFNVLASCGQQFPLLQEIVKKLFLKLYREKESKFLLKPKIIPCMRVLFNDDFYLKKWLVDNGIADLEVNDYPERIITFSRTFDLIIEDLESLGKELRRINLSLGKWLKKAVERKFIDIGDLTEYIRVINQLRVNLSTEFSYDKFGTRQSLNMKAYRVFLNSGGLTSTHSLALAEQQKWLACRNEEGPIGTDLEKELEKRIESVRSLIARYIGAETSDCIIFTHNTTSSIDLVLRSLLRPGDEVLTTDLEHDVVYYLGEYYQKHFGCNFVKVPIGRNLLAGKDWIPIFTSQIGRRTRLVILSHVLFSIGAVLPIKEIIKKCREVSRRLDQRIFILVDGAHAVGNIKVNVKDLDCDFYAFDGHKWLLGPEGTGFLYCKEKYLVADNSFSIHFPFSTAFMVSSKYAPKKKDGRNYELGTMEVSKIIGLGASLDALSKLNFSEISKWRKHLVKKFTEGIRDTQWKIISPTDVSKSGMICLQIMGHEQSEIYEKIVHLLEKSNIIIRSLDKPPCIRLCFHHYNNETDAEIAAFHLKALLEGVNIHIGNHEKIKIKLKKVIQTFLKTRKPSKLASYIGLNIFSIAGAGKSYVVNHILEELKKTGIIASYFAIRAKDILKLENPEKEFASILDKAWKKMPAIIFLDEADALLEEKQKGILGIFNEEYNRIIASKKAKIVFITAENDPQAIYESAERRLKLAYFPLPDFETRLKYLHNLAKGRNCSSTLLLTQIARLTEGYSMSDLKKLWETTIENAENMVLTPQHFQMGFQLVKRTASDELLEKYAEMIRNLKPMIFTGEIEMC